MRLPNTTGDERLPIGTRHARFSPLGDHLDGRLVSSDRPSRAGPRHSGQSDAPTTDRPQTSSAAATVKRRVTEGRKPGCSMIRLRNPLICRLRAEKRVFGVQVLTLNTLLSYSVI